MQQNHHHKKNMKLKNCCLPQACYATNFPRPPPWLAIDVVTFVSPPLLLVGVSLVQHYFLECFG